ncbi:hypothetical protein VNO77_17639 [Canavalia gladiata]|uniref:Uncharacterized protein n=1 Tax=Canavalia gladiata TaxID=3824 RepID=A0AAN9LJC5_CANGL
MLLATTADVWQILCLLQITLILYPKERDCIPNDVPKGHLVVYVGENHKRYVINITLLTHPLFKPLLDQAQDEYDFTAHSKLYIPCNEHLFLTVLRSATSLSHKSFFTH